MRRVQIVLVSGLGLALVATGGVIFHQSRKLVEVRHERDTALQSLERTHKALQQSEHRLAEALRKTPKPSNDNKAAIARRDSTIKQLTVELNAAQAGITDLQKKLTAAQNDNEKRLADASQQYQAQQTELQGRLDKLQKDLNSTRADLQNSHQRIASLKRANDQLQDASNAGSVRAGEREHILSSLQDIDRRRESYLTSIADRYRNLTNQFRTMSGMMNSNRGQDSNAFSGPALDMIQNAITLTDNDLQHLNELSAKAYRLEKQLSKK